MKINEKGYSLIEVLIATTIMVMASGVAGAAIFQILGKTQNNSDHMTAVRQVENAGHWMSHDSQMALTITTTDNLTLPNFLFISWTTWNGTGDTTGNAVYHSVTYSFGNMTDGIGTLERTYTLNRNYWTSDGADQTSQVAQHIYYNTENSANSSNVSSQNQALTLKLSSLFEGLLETREYKIGRRANF